jgi:hypothetical protein
MEAIGARAYGVVVFAQSGAPEAPSFWYKKSNNVQYNVVLYTFRVMQQKGLNFNETGPRWNLTGRERRGYVRLGACVRGITDSHRRPTVRSTGSRPAGSFNKRQAT